MCSAAESGGEHGGVVGAVRRCETIQWVRSSTACNCVRRCGVSLVDARGRRSCGDEVGDSGGVAGGDGGGEAGGEGSGEAGGEVGGETCGAVDGTGFRRSSCHVCASVVGRHLLGPGSFLATGGSELALPLGDPSARSRPSPCHCAKRTRVCSWQRCARLT